MNCTALITLIAQNVLAKMGDKTILEVITQAISVYEQVKTTLAADTRAIVVPPVADQELVQEVLTAYRQTV